jgi:hypothetical protein
LVRAPLKRNGALILGEENGYDALKKHAFFKGIDWENLFKSNAPAYKVSSPFRNHSFTSFHKNPLHSQTSSKSSIEAFPCEEKKTEEPQPTPVPAFPNQVTFAENLLVNEYYFFYNDATLKLLASGQLLILKSDKLIVPIFFPFFLKSF